MQVVTSVNTHCFIRYKSDKGSIFKFFTVKNEVQYVWNNWFIIGCNSSSQYNETSSLESNFQGENLIDYND